jgi:hypothetical protein
VTSSARSNALLKIGLKANRSSFITSRSETTKLKKENAVLHQIPELGQLKEIQVPAEYQGEPPQRIKDYLTGFKMAWEIAIRMQQDHALGEPRESAE